LVSLKERTVVELLLTQIDILKPPKQDLLPCTCPINQTRCHFTNDSDHKRL